ncbi:MAG TPA: N-acetylneuraminate synthase family protein [Thermoleophilaceae bacterium]
MADRRTTIIAEIGENHAGDIELARRMVAEAARAGADVVKFQSYRGADVAPDDPEREWFTQVELSDRAHRDLAELARSFGVAFMSTPFSLERARFLVEELGLTAIKVASSEMLNFALLDYLAERVETVFLSTGMADLDEVRLAVARLEGVEHVVIMHCVTQYPLADDHANLRAISTLAEAFPGRSVGYSDHTIGLLAPLLAVALGATAIEKHFTLDRSLPGTDHVLSLTPDELAALVRTVRRSEALLGREGKQPAEPELEIREFVRGRFPKPAPSGTAGGQ